MTRTFRRGAVSVRVLVTILCLLLVSSGLSFWFGLTLSPPPEKDSTGEGSTTYYCAMHPSITLPHPGKCSICGMELVPRSVVSEIREGLVTTYPGQEENHKVVREMGEDYDVHQVLTEIEGEMLEAAESLEFERAAVLRDELKEIRRGIEE